VSINGLRREDAASSLYYSMYSLNQLHPV